MLGTAGVSGDIGQVDFGLGSRGQLDLRLFGGLFEALQGELVLLQVDAVLFLELVGQIFDEAHVEIFTAQEGVAIGGLHLEDAVADFQHGHVEGAAAKVIDRDGAGALLVETIGERGRRGLVDDAQHFQTGDPARVLGGLTLGVVEIGGNRDDGLGHRLAQIGLGGLLHLRQGEGGDLRGGILLAVRIDPGVAIASLDDLVGDQTHVLLGHGIVEGATDQALDREEGALGIGDRLALGRLAHEALAVVGESHDGGRGACAFRILDDLGGRPFHHAHAGIGGAEVDANHFCHVYIPFRSQNPGPRSDPVYGRLAIPGIAGRPVPDAAEIGIPRPDYKGACAGVRSLRAI